MVEGKKKGSTYDFERSLEGLDVGLAEDVGDRSFIRLFGRHKSLLGSLLHQILKVHHVAKQTLVHPQILQADPRVFRVRIRKDVFGKGDLVEKGA